MSQQMFDEGQNGSPHVGSIWALVSLLVAAVLIFFVCLLFYQFCEPTPGTFEQVVFYALIFLIFLETVYAGLYRSEE